MVGIPSLVESLPVTAPCRSKGLWCAGLGATEPFLVCLSDSHLIADRNAKLVSRCENCGQTVFEHRSWSEMGWSNMVGVPPGCPGNPRQRSRFDSQCLHGPQEPFRS